MRRICFFRTMLGADREVEHCKIADPRRKLQTDANGLNLLELQLGLLPRQPALVPELSLSGIDFLGFHVNLLSMKGDTVCTLAQLSRFAPRRDGFSPISDMPAAVTCLFRV